MAMIQIGGCIRGIELTFANADQRYSRDTALASTGLRPAFDQPSSQTRTHAAWRGLVAYTKQSRAPSQPQLQDPSSSLKNASPGATGKRCDLVNNLAGFWSISSGMTLLGMYVVLYCNA